MTAEVASSLKDWSTSEGANEPTGSRTVGPNTDDNMRMIQAVVRTLAARDTIASSATTDLGSKPNAFLTVTGTTGITSFGSVSGGIWKVLVFEGALTITHNATSLMLPGGSITTAAGDIGWFISEGSGNWRCLMYMRRSGAPLMLAMPDGSTGTPGLSFASDPDNGFYRIGSNNWAVSVGGAKALEFSSTQIIGEKPVRITATSASQPHFSVQASTTAARQSAFAYEGGPNANFSTDHAAFKSYFGASAGGAHQMADDTQGGSGGAYFIRCRSNMQTAPDVEFLVTTAGAVSSDGGASMTTPADYAEMFEWEDGNPGREDRVGMSVALVGEKIRIAQPGDESIGVVSAMPAVLADAGDLRWSGKYLRDDFGRYVLNPDGTRVENPDFDPAAEYIPRRDRPEWAPVGLMGKLRVRAGQQIGSRWVLMRPIAPGIDEYLVR